jgi:hypothetical protein
LSIDWGFVGVLGFGFVVFIVIEYAYQWIVDRKRGLR